MDGSERQTGSEGQRIQGPTPVYPGILLLDEQGVYIREFRIRNADVAEYLRRLPEAERPAELVKAVEVGVYCLERVGTARDLDFVRHQVERLLTEIRHIPQNTERALRERLGNDNDSVLSPIREAVISASNTVADKLQSVRTLLDEHVDPTRETSALGRALRTIRDFLDPNRKDSIQGALEAAIEKVATADGQLARSVREVVGQEIKPLQQAVNELGRELRGEHMAQAALQDTPYKGIRYEEEVVSLLSPWQRAGRLTIEHVGSDNRPGDILVQLMDDAGLREPLKIVIEVRDRAVGAGRRPIARDMNEAMAQREAAAGIYLSRGIGGLAKEIGDWAEGVCERGRWVACTPDHLLTAIRYLAALAALDRRRDSIAKLDADRLAGQVRRIRAALRSVLDINTKARRVEEIAQAMREEAKHLKDEIEDAVAEMEQTMREAASRPSSSEQALGNP